VARPPHPGGDSAPPSTGLRSPCIGSGQERPRKRKPSPICRASARFASSQRPPFAPRSCCQPAAR
jgi:hypothetical protein